jgi:hypothetical protein
MVRSDADIVGNTITGNGSGDVNDFHCGIGIFWHSVVFTEENTVSGNTYCAVDIGQVSFWRSGPFTGADPADADILNQDGCTGGENAGTCGTAGSVAIDVFRLGDAEPRNTIVTGRVEVFANSIFDIGGPSEMFGDVDLSADSGGRIRNSVVGNGTLNCFDTSYQAGSGVACGGGIPAP